MPDLQGVSERAAQPSRVWFYVKEWVEKKEWNLFVNVLRFENGEFVKCTWTLILLILDVIIPRARISKETYNKNLLSRYLVFEKIEFKDLSSTRVPRAILQRNVFKIYFLENDTLNEKILSHIFYSFFRVECPRVNYSRLSSPRNLPNSSVLEKYLINFQTSFPRKRSIFFNEQISFFLFDLFFLFHLLSCQLFFSAKAKYTAHTIPAETICRYVHTFTHFLRHFYIYRYFYI